MCVLVRAHWISAIKLNLSVTLIHQTLGKQLSRAKDKQ